MTALIALIRKDLLLFLNDKRARLLNLAMPILLAAFFGSLFGGSGVVKPSKIDIGVVLQDQSATGRKIAAGLAADANLNVVELSLADAQARVRAGKLAVAVVIPQDFGERAGAALFNPRDKPQIPMLYDPSQAMVLAMAKGLLTQQVMQVVSGEMFSGTGGHQLTEQSLAQVERMAANDPQRAELSALLRGVKQYQARRAADEERSGHTAPATPAAAATTAAMVTTAAAAPAAPRLRRIPRANGAAA